MAAYGPRRLDMVLQPISGKALPLYAGEVLRLTQLGDAQCIDFNAFNLHDYKERMDVGTTRAIAGFRPAHGDIMFSNPPRYRPMVGILEMQSTCQTDLLGRSCHATTFEGKYGFAIHTNCQDTLAESISEYGLTPDDVHDSFNLWMNTEWDSTGRWWITANTGVAGEHVDLLALFDILAVSATCGGGDVSYTSNFAFKPVGLQVFEASPETLEIVGKVQESHGSYNNQRGVDRFRVQEVKVDRELSPVPGWKPDFVNFPIRVEDITVPLTRREYEMATELQERGFGRDLPDVIRRVTMLWYNKHRARGAPPKLPLA